MSCAAPTPTRDSNVEEDKKPEFFSHIELKVKGQVRFSLFFHVYQFYVLNFSIYVFLFFLVFIIVLIPLINVILKIYVY